MKKSENPSATKTFHFSFSRASLSGLITTASICSSPKERLRPFQFTTKTRARLPFSFSEVCIVFRVFIIIKQKYCVVLDFDPQNKTNKQKYWQFSRKEISVKTNSRIS